MSMPLFSPADNPGSNFTELVRRVGLLPENSSWNSQLDVPHATTCVALRFSEGVLVAGDRRATSGNWISHRGMEKVVQTDRYSAVAISGAAGPAMDMIKLFTLQLEHYEKMEGRQLSLEGKANQLSMMVRGNLPAAMQGMMVLPLFAGFDPVDERGRIWDYDATGGRYEEREYVAIGSGGMLAGTVIKVGWKSELSSDAAIELACRSLWEAADADSATGGPDALRGVYPIIAVIDKLGWRQISDEVLSGIFAALAEEMRTR
jgi:proteasome beta subunit